MMYDAVCLFILGKSRSQSLSLVTDEVVDVESRLGATRAWRYRRRGSQLVQRWYFGVVLQQNDAVRCQVLVLDHGAWWDHLEALKEGLGEKKMLTFISLSKPSVTVIAHTSRIHYTGSVKRERARCENGKTKCARVWHLPTEANDMGWQRRQVPARQPPRAPSPHHHPFLLALLSR